MNGTAVRPITVRLDDGVLAALQARLETARFPDDDPAAGWARGTSTSYLRELVAHWRDHYDWRAAQARINARPQYEFASAAGPIHFTHVRSPRPDALPLVLTHGWPWTFLDWEPTIDALTQPPPGELAFDVVVPSLPGFCLSAGAGGPNWWETADLWADLMTALGYPTFGAVGGDWGAWVTAQLGHRYPDRLLGVHLLDAARLEVWGTDRPWDLFEPARAGLSPGQRAAFLDFERKAASHVTVQVLDPTTLAHALHDSPVGLCSWLIERRRAWSDCAGDLETVYSKDDLITSTMLYWATGSVASSLGFYPAAVERPWAPDRAGTRVVVAPVGLSTFEHHARRPGPWVDDYYNLQWRASHPVGGHFAPAEQPAQVVADVRASFGAFDRTR